MLHLWDNMLLRNWNLLPAREKKKKKKNDKANTHKAVKGFCIDEICISLYFNLHVLSKEL
jgi:hypothetical protein